MCSYCISISMNSMHLYLIIIGSQFFSKNSINPCLGEFIFHKYK